MEAQLLLETMAKACAIYASESERVVEEFETAGDDIWPAKTDPARRYMDD